MDSAVLSCPVFAHSHFAFLGPPAHPPGPGPGQGHGGVDCVSTVRTVLFSCISQCYRIRGRPCLPTCLLAYLHYFANGCQSDCTLFTSSSLSSLHRGKRKRRATKESKRGCLGDLVDTTEAAPPGWVSASCWLIRLGRAVLVAWDRGLVLKHCLSAGAIAFLVPT